MLWCYVSGECKSSYASFRAHINRHANDYDLTRPLRCCQNGCKCTFMQTFNFLRHIKAYHANDDDTQIAHLPAAAQSVANSGVDNGGNTSVTVATTCSEDVTSVNPLVRLEEMKVEGVSLVAALRANSGIPYCVVPQVIDSFNQMSNCLIAACEAEAVRCFTACTAGNNTDVMNKFNSSLHSSMKYFTGPLSFLDGKYKQDNFFRHHDSFVTPQSISFGMRLESRCGKTVTVYDTYEYVSVQETLTALLSNEQYATGLLAAQNSLSDPGIISHYSDGELAKARATVTDSQKLSIHLQLF
jgi:hypothetical protein